MRIYFTWEEDFLSQRRELHGYNDELIAVVDQNPGEILYFIENAAGLQIMTGMRLADALKFAEGMLES